MSDEDDRTEFIRSKSKKLSKSTVIGAELVLGLYEKGLINEDEKDTLNNHFTPNVTRAMVLYTSIANRWNQNQFDDFQQVLKNTGNLSALLVFTSAGAEFFLTTEQAQLLKDQAGKSKDGSYEGFMLEDELAANQIVQYSRNDQLFQEGKFQLPGDLNRKEVIQLVRQFAESYKNEVIWWNPQKPPLIRNYIPRRIYCKNQFHFYEKRKSPQTLIDLTHNKLVLLVDSPGMGKSTEVTNLEIQLRTTIKSNRVILRINLNEVQSALSKISESESAPIVLLKLAPFLPSTTFKVPSISVFVLLDGLDEVCPKHQSAMINLLRIFRTSSDRCDLHVVVTSRPHLRKVMEAEFNLIPWSLFPLTEEQQENYLRAVGVSNEVFTPIRSTITQSVAELLSNPLMLFMLVGVLRSGGNQSAADYNIHDLYTRFVDAKHELHCVEKLRMEAADNYTDIFKVSMLSKNLPFYYHVTLNEFGMEHYSDLSAYVEWMERIAAETPTTGTESIVTTELLSYGLLIEGQEKRLVFKHRSFAEFFYARLITHEQSTPQIVRGILFGRIYADVDVLENVEAFVAAGLSKRNEGTQIINITTKWMLTDETVSKRRDLLKLFVDGNLFPLCAPEVLMRFVDGDPVDLWEAFRILVDRRSREVFVKIFVWLSENREWSRNELFKINEHILATTYSPPYARLIVAIAINFEAQKLFSAEEVGVAIRSNDNRLIYTVASSRTAEKWDFTDRHLGKSHLRKLLLKADDEDFPLIIKDKETAWKLAANLSEEEIHSLVTNEETRVTDVVGRVPWRVCAVLGAKFICGLAEFRGKFGADKGKTVFELSECLFALDYLWSAILQEKDDNNLDGPVRVALREALGRSSSDLLDKLVDDLRRRSKCKSVDPSDRSILTKICEECDGMMDWILGGAPFWNSSPTFPPEFLPFAVRYSRNVPLVKSILQPTSFHLSKDSTVMDTLRSLILSACCRDDENFSYFSLLVTYFQENLHQEVISANLRFVVGEFIGTTKEKIKIATPTLSRSGLPPFDVSVGLIFLRILQHSTIAAVSDSTWKKIVSDIIQFTRCCQLPAVLEELKGKFINEDLLRQTLTCPSVLSQWTPPRFSSFNRKTEEECDMCGITHLISFYFSVFGVNLHWMKSPTDWKLVRVLPVEIATALEGNLQWKHLLPEFAQLLRAVHLEDFDTRGGVLFNVPYRTEWEWELLLHLIKGEKRLVPESPMGGIPSCIAAPLIRVLMRMLGVQAAKDKVSNLWKYIPSYIILEGELPESLGSLLHTAIELGELAEVKRRSFPGLLKWKNPQGKTAIQVAMATCGHDHPITLHLYSHTLSKRPSLEEIVFL